MIPVSELSLSSSGVFARETTGSVENFWDVCAWVGGKGAAWGMTLVGWFSKSRLVGLGHSALLSLGFGSQAQYIPSSIMGPFISTPVLSLATQANLDTLITASISMIPVAGPAIWDNTVGQWFFPYENVVVRNRDAPPEDWIYYDPITEANTNLADQKTVFRKTVNYMQETYEQGKEKIKETVGSMVQTASDTVQKVFYGVCVIGGMTLLYKMVS